MMNNLQLQTLFDSVCRCFGHAPGSNGGPTASGVGLSNSHHNLHEAAVAAQAAAGVGAGAGAGSSAPEANANAPAPATTPMVEASHSQVGKRRTNRLGLQDEQWDELFEKKNKKKATATAATAAAAAATSSTGKNTKSVAMAKAKANVATNNNDLTTAQALAQAKLAANPPRYTRASKRKRSGKAREEIFRNKEAAAQNQHHAAQGAKPSAHAPRGNRATISLSRLLHPSLVMCFATPIRGTQDEPEDMDVRSVDNSDTNTLNTCEDTITSTVYYDNKLAQMTETRPPMPLFNQFKIGPDKDEIQQIMATDSHSSVNMIRLLQQQKAAIHPKPTAALEPDSSSSEDGRLRGSSRKTKTQRTGAAAAAANGHHIVSGRSNASHPNSCLHQHPNQHHAHQHPADEEMQDAVPDVKAVSDSSGSDASIRHHHQHPSSSRATSQQARRQVYEA